MAKIETVAVGGTIRLGQFLKLTNIADTGGMARELIADGYVRVNGEVERRRGRQLAAGDVVTVEAGGQLYDLGVG